MANKVALLVMAYWTDHWIQAMDFLCNNSQDPSQVIPGKTNSEGDNEAYPVNVLWFLIYLILIVLWKMHAHST